MSVESLAIALHHSRSRGTARIVLIGIANHDGDGGAWPSVATLAKYAGVHPRNVQRALEQLEALQEIRREIQRGGMPQMPDPRRPNLYTFRLVCPPDCDRSRQHRTPQEATIPAREPFGPSEPSKPAPSTAVLAPSTGGGVATHGESAARGAGATGGVAPAPSEAVQRTTTKTIAENSRTQTRARGWCGHLLIDDRHCFYACPTAPPLAVTA